MKNKRILAWFRNDLRLHDNEMLVEAIAKSDSILPVYFFDPRYFEQNTRFGTDKTGVFRACFLIESVLALRAAFQKMGGDILLIHGKPEDHIRELVEQFDIAEVYHHREVGPEETLISGHVEDLLWTLKINLKHFIGHTLYNKEDLPFPIKDIPDVFVQFKKKTERDAIVKSCFLFPEKITFVPNEEWGNVPSLDGLGFKLEANQVTKLPIKGGEEAGLEHLRSLLAEGSSIYLKNSHKSTVDRPGFSSQLSAWLALGCLSPRKVYWQVKEAEGKFGSNANFNQILLGLLWRDYFRFMFKKHGIAFFREQDLENDIPYAIESADPSLEKWKAGLTGNPVVDKFMFDLNNTGFIPHAGRLLVATFLVHVLKIHWTCGAAYFEEKLIDYAPASNWGNWASIAGVGRDAKSRTGFDLNKQIKILDVTIPGSPSLV